MRTQKILGIFFLCFAIPFTGFLHAAEEKRDAKGYLVSQDNYLKIPSDMKVNRVANNVITPEPDIDYLARKLETQEKQLNDILLKVTDIDSRLKKQEQK